MYPLPDMTLAAADEAALAGLQKIVDGGADFATRVTLAKDRFDAKSATLFKRIRAHLALLSGDLVRCGYCEDSCADEVEHIRPKDFYPEQVFVWFNYLFACGPCNGGKTNKYAVRDGQGTLIDLRAHRKVHGMVAPPPGTHVLIDPRTEQPMDFLWLDITGGTFRLVALEEDDGVMRQRAETTIEYLKLNREVLVDARKNAFGGYRDRLAQYVARKAAGDAAAELMARARDIGRTPHRTVWLEMKRQRTMLADIVPFFDEAPEALGW